MKLVRLILALIVAFSCLFLEEQVQAQFVNNPSANAPAQNPDGGQGNYLPINTPTFTGLMTGPSLQLNGGLNIGASQSWSLAGITAASITAGNVAANSLTIAGHPIGGSCSGSDFINAISATGIVSCATPAGGGSTLPTPVSIANGGTGGATAPATGQILVAQSTVLYGPVPMTGDVTITSAGVTTVHSVGGVPGPFVQQSAGPFAPLTNPANGQNNYAPINAPAFTGTTTMSAAQVANTLSAPTASFGNVTVNTSGVLMLAGSASLYFNGVAPGGTCAAGSVMNALSATIVPSCVAVVPPAGSITDSMLANAYSGVGSCSANNFVTALNRNAAPTCSPASSVPTPYAVNIGGTGTGTAPTAAGQILVAQSGTAYAPVTMSGDVAITATGATTVLRSNGNLLTALFAPLVNPAGGQNNYLPIAGPTFTGTLTGPTHTGTTLNISGTATISGTANFPDGSSIVTAGANNGVAGSTYGFNNVTNLAVGTTRGSTTTIGGNTLILGQPTSPAMLLESTGFTPAGAIIYTNSTTGQEWITHNATTTNGGGAWTAWSGIDAEIINFNGGSGQSQTTFFNNSTGLTVGQPYTPTAVGQFNNTGLNILTGTLYLNGNSQFATGPLTPSFGCTGGNPAIGGAGPGGWYTTAGNMVLFYFSSFWSSMSGGAGQGTVGGLPFPAVGVDSGQGGSEVQVAITNANGTRGRLLATIFGGESQVRFYDAPPVGDYLVPLTCANTWANTPSGFFMTGTYRYR